MARSHGRDSLDRIKEEQSNTNRKKKSIAAINKFQKTTEKKPKSRRRKKCATFLNASFANVEEGGYECQCGKKWLRWPIFLLLFAEWFVMIVSNMHAAPAFESKKMKKKNSAKTKPNQTKRETLKKIMKLWQSSWNDVNIWRLLSATFSLRKWFLNGCCCCWFCSSECIWCVWVEWCLSSSVFFLSLILWCLPIVFFSVVVVFWGFLCFPFHSDCCLHFPRVFVTLLSQYLI